MKQHTVSRGTVNSYEATHRMSSGTVNSYEATHRVSRGTVNSLAMKQHTECLGEL